MNLGIKIDGTTYNVMLVYPDTKRSFSIPQGRASGKSLAYSDIDDIFGTEYGYQMNVEPVPGQEEEYDAFFDAISAPIGFHTVELPYGQSTLEFSAKITGGSDTYLGKIAGKQRFGVLSISFVPTEPQRRP